MNDIQDSMDWTPQMALDEAKKVVESNDPPDAIMVIFLWNQNQFSHRFMNVGMKCSEMVALLEIQKNKIIEIMKAEDKKGEM
jgi:hypothetical protein